MGKIIKNGVEYSFSPLTNAGGVSYSNTTSGLSSTNVQSAIDEIDTKLDSVERIVTELKMFTSDTLSINGNTHVETTLTIPTGVVPTGKDVFCAILASTPNSAWIFANVAWFSNTQVKLGAYNTYTQALSGRYSVLLICK